MHAPIAGSDQFSDSGLVNRIEQLWQQTALLARLFRVVVGRSVFVLCVALALLLSHQPVVDVLGFFVGDRSRGLGPGLKRAAPPPKLEVHDKAAFCLFHLDAIDLIGTAFVVVETDLLLVFGNHDFLSWFYCEGAA